MPLTDMEIRKMKAGPRLYRRADGGGLMLEVSPNGTKRFRLSYRLAGARKMMLIGDYPGLTLADARRRREVACRYLRDGGDPRECLELVKSRPAMTRQEPPYIDDDVPPEETFRAYLRRYLAKRRAEGAAPATMVKLDLHGTVLLGAFGGKAISNVTPKDVLRACRVCEAQKRFHSANSVRVLASQVFRFAIANEATLYDPAAPIKDAVVKSRSKRHAAVIDPKEIGALMAALRSASARNAQVRAGLLLSAYLAPRSSELREMRWARIAGAVWTIPGNLMKLDRDHLVPLPRQALDVLEWIRPITGSQERVLHSFISNRGLVSENPFNKALDLLGYDTTRHRQHGFRTTFSTTLNERGWNWDWIEMQLSHVEENKIRGAYNRALYLEDRTRMMQAYADLLDEFMRDHQTQKRGGGEAG